MITIVGYSETLLNLQDGLGDTIRVSLTEPPEEEIDPCRRLAYLGMRAAELQQGVVRFYNIFSTIKVTCLVTSILTFRWSYELAF